MNADTKLFGIGLLMGLSIGLMIAGTCLLVRVIP